MKTVNGYEIKPFADLSHADLSHADLSLADLSIADLSHADLSLADLSHADLSHADLSLADLSHADLSLADLSHAGLSGADLRGSDLSGADLRGSDLTGTLLAPGAGVLPASDQEILDAGLLLDGCLVWGWHTATSMHVGSNKYLPGTQVFANALSVDSTTACHPGIYLAGREWLWQQYGEDVELVRVCCMRHSLVHAGDKWRTSSVWVYSLDYVAPFER